MSAVPNESNKQPCKGCRRTELPDELKPKLTAQQEEAILAAVKITDLDGFRGSSFFDLHEPLISLLYPPPYYHSLRKNESPGVQWYDGDRYYVEHKDQWFYHCEHCNIIWEDDEAEEEIRREGGPDIVAGCDPPRLYHSLSFYAEAWNQVFRTEHPDEYKIAIGLLWFYEEWVVDKSNFKPSQAHLSLTRWAERKSDIWSRVFGWWAMNVTDIRTVLVNRITATLVFRFMPLPPA